MELMNKIADEEDESEQEPELYAQKESNAAGKAVPKQSRIEEIELSVKDRTKQMMKIQRKYSGSHLLSERADNKRPWQSRGTMQPMTPAAH